MSRYEDERRSREVMHRVDDVALKVDAGILDGPALGAMEEEYIVFTDAGVSLTRPCRRCGGESTLLFDWEELAVALILVSVRHCGSAPKWGEGWSLEQRVFLDVVAEVPHTYYCAVYSMRCMTCGESHSWSWQRDRLARLLWACIQRGLLPWRDLTDGAFKGAQLAFRLWFRR